MTTTNYVTVIRQALTQLIEELGARVLDALMQTGAMVQFLGRSLLAGARPPFRWQLILQQAEFVGFGSLFIILLTGSFTGAVFTLQSISAFERVGMESIVGSTVMVAVSRELAPVLTSLMVTGRVGSAMATELGTMRVTEQIDAMEVMAVDPIQYLIFPRVVAGAIMVPALTAIFDMVAFFGAYLVGVVFLGLDEGAFISRIEWFVDPWDFMHGIQKSIVFGIVVTTVGCYKGFHASGGSRGVGVATTQAVVIGSVLTFVLDYVLTAMLLALR